MFGTNVDTEFESVNSALMDVTNALNLKTMTPDATTARTLKLSDMRTILRFTNAGAVTLTVPKNTTTAIPIGAFAEIHQSGAGTVTVAAASGVTINSISTSKASSAQYAVMHLVKVDTDVWNLSGSLGA